MRKLIILSYIFFAVTAKASNADWPMFRHDAYRTGLSAATGELDSVKLRWDWKLPSCTPEMLISAPVIGDIDNDDTNEIVIASTTNGTVYALKDSIKDSATTHGYDTLMHYGRVVWQYKVSSEVQTTPLLFDINNDSKLEVIFGSHNDSLYALDGKGNLLWSFGTGDMINSSPVAGDMENDGNIEITFGSWDGYVYVLDNNGNLKCKYLTGNSIKSSPALADINKDDTLEIIIGSTDGKLYDLQPNGSSLTMLWSYDTQSKIYSTPAIGDLDKDGTLDVVLMSMDGYVYAVSGATHSMLWYYSTGSVGSYLQCQSAGLADIDKDNKLEVIIGSFGSDSVYVLEGATGVEQWAKGGNYFSNFPVPSSPAIADIDSDDTLEIVMSVHNGYCYAWPWRRRKQPFLSKMEMGL